MDKETVKDENNMIVSVHNGHGLELLFVGEQGGGLEELMVWCHTCDPVGLDTQTFPLREYEDFRDCLNAATECATGHSEEPVAT